MQEFMGVLGLGVVALVCSINQIELLGLVLIIIPVMFYLKRSF